MFQSFETRSDPSHGPARLAALRQELARDGLAGFIVPRADAHQGEDVAPRDERLKWLTGFTGSAGFCVVLPEAAGVFIDGRYRVQVKSQVDLGSYTPVAWPEVSPGTWIKERLSGGRIGFDPWLHGRDEIQKLEKSLEKTGISLSSTKNYVDAVWPDQPQPPAGAIAIHELRFTGKDSASKRQELATDLRKAGHHAAVLSLPDSVCWLLNIRGSDIERTPVAHAFAILHDDARVSLFIDAAKLSPEVRAHLGDGVSVRPPSALVPALHTLSGPVRVDPNSAPFAVSLELAEAGVEVAYADDPCRLPKARKNAAEIAGMEEAHLRDGAAMVEFLSWFDREAPKGHLTEIAAVRALEGFRRATNALRDLSFETICGAGEHGAIMHYRVTEDTDRALRPGELIVLDSGAQYIDGTTDITRTLAIGDPGDEARACFTRVLQGMIAISRARFPKGLAGRDLDPLARYPLWLAGLDFNHGTGHGVGAYLSVHEGPQRISRVSEVPLEVGMILSNEPGYYREGAFGIRIENLIVTEEAPPLPGADDRKMLAFRTLTFVPIDRNLVVTGMLSAGERNWLNAYHVEVLAKLAPRLSTEALAWLTEATAPI